MQSANTDKNHTTSTNIANTTTNTKNGHSNIDDDNDTTPHTSLTEPWTSAMWCAMFSLT